MTYADLFSGFGGATCGAMAAGLTPLWGIEYDAKIAAVANENLGRHVHLANVLDVDPHTLPRVDVLHASPPCPNFSQAKTNGEETELDKSLARKVVRFIDVLRPRIFTLENVYQYRNSQSWAIIQNNLFDMGYWVSIEHVNAADYGVPQTRQRMIVRAVQGGWIPYLPAAQKWVGWYEAIEDLIPTLPESQFAPWQLKRLPDALKTCMVAQGGFDGNIAIAKAEQPALTITANTNQTNVRAFIMSGANTQFGSGLRRESEPAFTITVQCDGRARAWLVDCANSNHDVITARNGNEPSLTIHASLMEKNPLKALAAGKIVSMTPNALARFQSFPDWYKLPDSKTLAARGIGNAVAPLLYQRIIEGLTQS